MKLLFDNNHDNIYNIEEINLIKKNNECLYSNRAYIKHG